MVIKWKGFAAEWVMSQPKKKNLSKGYVQYIWLGILLNTFHFLLIYYHITHYAIIAAYKYAIKPFAQLNYTFDYLWDLLHSMWTISKLLIIKICNGWYVSWHVGCTMDLRACELHVIAISSNTILAYAYISYRKQKD